MALKDVLRRNRDLEQNTVSEPNPQPFSWPKVAKPETSYSTTASEMQRRIKELEETIFAREGAYRLLRQAYEELRLRASAISSGDIHKRQTAEKRPDLWDQELTVRAANLEAECQRLREDRSKLSSALNELKAIVEGLRRSETSTQARLFEREQELHDLQGALRESVQLNADLKAALHDATHRVRSDDTPFEDAPHSNTERDDDTFHLHGLLSKIDRGDTASKAFAHQCRQELSRIQRALQEISSFSHKGSFRPPGDSALIRIALPERALLPSNHLEHSREWAPVIAALDKLRAQVLQQAREKLGVVILMPVPMVTRFDPSIHEESPNHRVGAPPNRKELAGYIFEVINPGLKVGDEVLAKAYVKRYAA